MGIDASADRFPVAGMPVPKGAKGAEFAVVQPLPEGYPQKPQAEPVVAVDVTTLEVTVPTGPPPGSEREYRGACFGTACCGLCGLLGTALCCNTLRGRAGAATGCMWISGVKLLVVILLIVLAGAGVLKDGDGSDADSRSDFPTPAPVSGIVYSWEIPQAECWRRGGDMHRSPLGPWCSRACPDGFVRRMQSLGRPEQREYCINQSMPTEPQPDLGWAPCGYTVGMRVRTLQDTTLPDGDFVAAGSVGRVTGVPGGAPGSAARVEVGGRSFDVRPHGARCPCEQYAGRATAGEGRQKRGMRARKDIHTGERDEEQGGCHWAVPVLACITVCLVLVLFGAFRMRRSWLASAEKGGARASVHLQVAPREMFATPVASIDP